jgi:hypothetical protein
LNESTRNVLFSADDEGDEDAEEMQSVHSSKIRWDPTEPGQIARADANDGQVLVTEGVDEEENWGDKHIQ